MKQFLIATLVLAATVTLQAQDVTYDRSYAYLGFRAGSLMVDTIDENADAAVGFMFGVRFTREVALELSYDDQFNGLLGTGWATDAYQASLLLYLPISERVQPYLVGGVGLYLSTYNYWVDDGYDSYIVSETDYSDAGFHAGAGVDLQLSPNVALTLDGRYIFVEEDHPDAIESDGFLTTVGIKFQF